MIERQILKELGKKTTRNLGRWVAPQLRGGTESLLVDCLPKTQVRAKAKADVYGLTLVQCR